MEAEGVLNACEHLLLLPPAQQSEASAQDFLAACPVEDVASAIQSAAAGPDGAESLKTIVRAVSVLLSLKDAAAVAPFLGPAGIAALQHPSESVQKLGCRIGRARIAALQPSDDPVEVALPLLAVLIKDDTGPSQAAAEALAPLAEVPDMLRTFLASPVAAPRLTAWASDSDAVVRSRALALLIRFASAGTDAADIVIGSGLLEPLMRELDDAGDPLACLAALELVCELAEQESVPAAVTAALVPRVMRLRGCTGGPDSDGLVHDAAIRTAARLVGRSGGSEDGASLAATLAAELEVERDAGSADREALLCDSVGALCRSRTVRAAVAVGPLLSAVALRALGRAVPAAVRVAALHALADCAGAEMLGAGSRPHDALLEPAAEECMRVAIYEASHPEARPELGPAQSVWELLQRPFSEIKVPVYRLAGALTARDWFAGELVQHEGLFSHMMNASSETGPLCKWRYGVVRVLAQVVAAASKRIHAGHPGALDALLAAKVGAAIEAEAAGPYGRPEGGEGDGEPEVQVAVATRT